MLSIIIPAYNEEKRIVSTLDEIISFMGKKKIDYEVVVAADGCVDRTPELVKSFGKKNKRVRMSYSKQRSGKGGGLRRAFRESRGDTIVFADADNAAQPAELLKLVKSLDSCDVAWGSRMVEGAKVKRKQPPHWELVGKSYIVLAKVFFLSPIKDIQCGYKAFKREVLEDTFDEVQSLGLAYDLDLLARVKKHGYKILEIPIVWSHVEGSPSHAAFSNSVHIGLEMIRTRVRTLW
jgi:glycosyltransferase involved in cell wall biosynthesis